MILRTMLRLMILLATFLHTLKLYQKLRRIIRMMLGGRRPKSISLSLSNAQSRCLTGTLNGEARQPFICRIENTKNT